MKKNAKSIESSIAVLIGKVNALCFLVNQKTKYAVFADFSGHVDNLSVEIKESKAEYRHRIYKKDLYVAGDMARNTEKELKQIILRLESCLAEETNLVLHEIQELAL